MKIHLTQLANRVALLLLVLVLSVPFVTSAQTPVLFSMQGLTGQANNRTILIQPDREQNLVTFGTNLVPSYDFTIQPIGGQVITNLIPWGYTIRVDGWPRGVHIVVPAVSLSNGPALNVVSLINTNQFSPLNLYVNTGAIALSQLPAQTVTNTYNLRSYGAYGDAVNAWGAMAISNSTTFTVTGGNFSSADVGKFINIKGGDVNRRDWWTTITAVNSATSITVASAVPVSYNLTLPGNVAAMSSGYSIIYGAHDDSMAMQAWVNQITNGGGKFYAPPGVYLILNPPTNDINSQIKVPICPLSAGNEVTYFDMYGSLASAPAWSTGTPRAEFDANTTVFVPNIGTSSNPGQWIQGMPSSFLDFRTAANQTPYGTQLGKVQLSASGYYITNTLTWPILHDFIVQCSYDPSAIMIDELGAQEGRGPKNVIIGTFLIASFCTQPSNTNGFGFVGPCNYSGQAGDARDLFVEGFYTGIDPGCTRLDYPVVICCKHAIASMFTGGGPQVNHISEAQFTDCPIWLYGSGDTNFYSAAGNASILFNPRMDVIEYAENSVGEQDPDWVTNSPYAIYDPSNQLNSAGCIDIAGWVRFAQIANGPAPLIAQGASPSVFPMIDVSACSTPGGVFGPSLSTITMQPQVYGGQVWITNGLTLSGPQLNANSGINETLPSGYYVTLQSLNSSDENDIGIGNNGAGKTTEWMIKTDDRYGDGHWVADLMFGPRQAGGSYYNYGFGGLGGTLMLWTNGDESVLGSMKASNNVVSVGGQFIGNAGGVSNVPAASLVGIVPQTNLPPPTCYFPIDYNGPYDTGTAILPTVGGVIIGFGKPLAQAAQTAAFWDVLNWPQFQWSGYTNQLFSVHIWVPTNSTVAWVANVRYMTNGLTSGGGLGVQNKQFATGVINCTTGTNDYWITATNNWIPTQMTNVQSAIFYLGTGGVSSNCWLISGSNIKAQ